jgi:hypothetical protein
VEWIVYFKNTGSADTPIIEGIQALDITVNSPTAEAVLHYNRGASCRPEDFQPYRRVMNPGALLSMRPGAGRIDN